MATATETSVVTYHVTALPDSIVTIADAAMMIRGEAAEPDVKQPSHATPSFPFFALPAELRTQIYEELLVSDASFRLGHHGPFCLVPRKTLHPHILRTSRRTLEEAAPVLYGANSFFLGTIGFKPIYSFSFFASIGKHNASLIRKLVTHSTYPDLTTRSYLQKWIDGLGIDFERLKVLAISFETKPIQVAAMPPPGPPPIGAPLQMQLLPANATLHSQGGPVGNMGTATNMFAGAIGAGQAAAMTVSAAANSAQTNMVPMTAAQTAVWTAANNMVSSVLGTQNWPPLASNTTHTPAAVLPSASTGHTPNASVAPAAGTVDFNAREDDGQYETCARREQLWLQKANTRMVQAFANVPNCDLRAGDCWLMYRDPMVRRLPRARLPQ